MSISEKDMKLIVNKVLNDLKTKKLISTCKNSFKSTEKILYSFKALPEALKLINEEISKLEIDYKNLRPTNIKTNTIILNEEYQTYVYGNESLETRISELKQIAIKTKSQIRIVNQALKKIEDDKYYKIIPLYYFDGLTQEIVAEKLEVSTGTISSNRSRLVNMLKVYIFPDTFMNEL